MTIQDDAGLNAIETERMSRILAEVVADCEDVIANPPCRVCGYWAGTHSRHCPVLSAVGSAVAPTDPES